MRARAILLPMLLWLLSVATAGAHMPTDKQALVNRIGFDQRLDTALPLALEFVDESGASVTLGDYFGTSPVILLFGYYGCKNLCGSVLESLIRTLNDIRLESGRDYRVVGVSIDPADSPQDARARKARFATYYAGGNGKDDWHLLTGREDSIRRLATATGFRYAYDPERREYLHAAGIMIVTAEGVISKYFYGVGYRARDVRLGLVDASRQRIGTPVDQLLLRCFHYDPATGQYSLAIVNLLRVMGIATVALISAGIGVLLLRERGRQDG